MDTGLSTWGKDGGPGGTSEVNALKLSALFADYITLRNELLKCLTDGLPQVDG